MYSANMVDCGDSLALMKDIPDGLVNIVLTSPPYNTGRNTGTVGEKKTALMKNHECRYDMYEERSNSDYMDWLCSFFMEFDRILAKDGVVLWNMSYGTENPMIMYQTICEIEKSTPFTVADTITWKKKAALPNNLNRNKLTRICEYVFVMCRKSEWATFQCNKECTSTRSTGQQMYSVMYNYVEAANNDGSNDLNKATFSTDLVCKLLDMYSPSEDDVVFDCFLGTGTTAIGAILSNRKYLGFELSPNQFEYASKRIEYALTQKRVPDMRSQGGGLFD